MTRCSLDTGHRCVRAKYGDDKNRKQLFFFSFFLCVCWDINKYTYNKTKSTIALHGMHTDNPSEASKPYNPSGVDVSYSTRHVEESWHHLMKSEDTNKFKQIAVCNFDFLLASVSLLLCGQVLANISLSASLCRCARIAHSETTFSYNHTINMFVRAYD